LQIGDAAAAYVANGSGGATVIATNMFFDGANKYATTAAAARYSVGSGNHEWYIAPSGTAGNAITFTQAMTLDASGNLLVGTTTAYARFASKASSGQGGGWFSVATNGDAAIFIANASNGTVGSIVANASTTSYNTSSDYRLKENVAPMQNALDTVAQLNPVTYTWKADGSAGQGFIAHELQAVVPDCVTGEKDAVDAEGNPQYQGVDTSFLVATLVKAIQELTARVAELENR
jgi:hypothetical protein